MERGDSQSVEMTVTHATANMEIESLKAIYPDECCILKNENGMKVITMLIPADFTRQSEAYAKLKISLPSKYPFVEFSFIVLSFL